MGTPGPSMGQCNGPQASGYKKARWALGTETTDPHFTMAQSCRPSGPALGSILLTLLLGGEWLHMSARQSVPANPFLPLGCALDPSGPLILMEGAAGIGRPTFRGGDWRPEW